MAPGIQGHLSLLGMSDRRLHLGTENVGQALKKEYPREDTPQTKHSSEILLYRFQSLTKLFMPPVQGG